MLCVPPQAPHTAQPGPTCNCNECSWGHMRAACSPRLLLSRPVGPRRGTQQYQNASGGTRPACCKADSACGCRVAVAAGDCPTGPCSSLGSQLVKPTQLHRASVSARPGIHTVVYIEYVVHIYGHYYTYTTQPHTLHPRPPGQVCA